MTTKFYLDLRGKAKDGKGTILITLFHNHSTATISTGIRVQPSEWKDQRIIKLAGCEALNASIQKKKTEIDRAIAVLSFDSRFDFMSASEVKAEIIDGKPKHIQGHLVSDVFKEYISNGMKPNTRLIYETTLGKILAFGGDNVKIENINLRWLNSFDQFLAKTQSINGRSIYLRALRAVCNYAKHTGLISFYPFENFNLKSEETRKRSISIEQLREFKDFPTTYYRREYRDIFFLMFYLIGINSKDLLLAKKSQVVNGRLEFIRAKTGKKYSIKIEPEAKTLIDKYAGSGEYLLNIMDRWSDYYNYTRKMDRELKKIGETKEELVPVSDDLFSEMRKVQKIIPIIPCISTYFARHTWATIAYEIGISLDVISQAMGHSSGNRTTLIYVKFDQEKVDEANRKVIDHLLMKHE